MCSGVRGGGDNETGVSMCNIVLNFGSDDQRERNVMKLNLCTVADSSRTRAPGKREEVVALCPLHENYLHSLNDIIQFV